jgi:hypothetical protein
VFGLHARRGGVGGVVGTVSACAGRWLFETGEAGYVRLCPFERTQECLAWRHLARETGFRNAQGSDRFSPHDAQALGLLDADGEAALRVRYDMELNRSTQVAHEQIALDLRSIAIAKRMTIRGENPLRHGVPRARG